MENQIILTFRALRHLQQITYPENIQNQEEKKINTTAVMHLAAKNADMLFSVNAKTSLF